MSANNYLDRCIGNYRIVALLGSGGFGSVYQGVHTILTDRIAAIKILHTYIDSVEERNRFLQEARLLANMQHPHILHIFDVGIDNGVPYLVAEYAPDGSLRAFIKRHAPNLLPIEISLSIISQIGQHWNTHISKTLFIVISSPKIFSSTHKGTFCLPISVLRRN